MTNAPPIPPIPPTVAAARTDQAWRAWAVASVQPTEAEIRIFGIDSAKELYVAVLWYAQQLNAAGCPTEYVGKLLSGLETAIKHAHLLNWMRGGGLGSPPPEVAPDLIWSTTSQFAAATMPGRGFDVY